MNRLPANQALEWTAAQPACSVGALVGGGHSASSR